MVVEVAAVARVTIMEVRVAVVMSRIVVGAMAKLMIRVFRAVVVSPMANVVVFEVARDTTKVAKVDEDRRKSNDENWFKKYPTTVSIMQGRRFLKTAVVSIMRG